MKSFVDMPDKFKMVSNKFVHDTDSTVKVGEDGKKRYQSFGSLYLAKFGDRPVSNSQLMCREHTSMKKDKDFP